MAINTRCTPLNQFQRRYMPEVFFVEGKLGAVVMHGGSCNEHISYERMMTKTIAFHQRDSHFRNSFIYMHYREFANMLLNQRKLLFIANTTVKFSGYHTAYKKVFFAKLFARTANNSIAFIQFNDNISIQNYHLYFRQAFSRTWLEVIRVFFPEPKVSQKSFLEATSLTLLSARGWISKANTSTVLPTKASGSVIDTCFWVAAMISLYTCLADILSQKFFFWTMPLSFLRIHSYTNHIDQVKDTKYPITMKTTKSQEDRKSASILPFGTSRLLT